MTAKRAGLELYRWRTGSGPAQAIQHGPKAWELWANPTSPAPAAEVCQASGKMLAPTVMARQYSVRRTALTTSRDTARSLLAAGATADGLCGGMPHGEQVGTRCE